jgi:hypothetical protein
VSGRCKPLCRCCAVASTLLLRVCHCIDDAARGVRACACAGPGSRCRLMRCCWRAARAGTWWCTRLRPLRCLASATRQGTCRCAAAAPAVLRAGTQRRMLPSAQHLAVSATPALGPPRPHPSHVSHASLTPVPAQVPADLLQGCVDLAAACGYSQKPASKQRLNEGLAVMAGGWPLPRCGIVAAAVAASALRPPPR